VKNISSCGPQKTTVIVSFLWSTVQCLLRTDHNKKMKPPVSHAPISKETVFRKIHFILAYAETIIKRFSKFHMSSTNLHMFDPLILQPTQSAKMVAFLRKRNHNRLSPRLGTKFKK